MSRPLRLLSVWFCCLLLLAGAGARAGAPILQIDMVAGEDAVFTYQDLSAWYGPGEVITATRGAEVVARLKVEGFSPHMTRLSIYDLTPGKFPRPGDRLVAQALPPKGPPVFSGERTGYGVALATDGELFVYENLSAFYPVGSVFRLVDGGVTVALARLMQHRGAVTRFAVELPPGLSLGAGLRLYPTESPSPLHPLLGPEERFIGRGQAYDDELPMGPRTRVIPGPREPELALPPGHRALKDIEGGREIAAAPVGAGPTDAGAGTTGAAGSGGASTGAGPASGCPAKVDSIGGSAEVKLDGGDWKKAELGACLFGGDAVRTGADSGLALALSDGGVVKFSATTTASLKGVRRKGEDREVDGVSVDTGELWADVAASSGAFDVTTPTGVVDVRGTEFSVRIDKDDKGDARLQVFTLEGEVHLTDKGGKVVKLFKGKTARILGAVLSDALDFDITSFKDYLDSWKNLLTPGGIRDFIKAKAFGMIQDKLNEQLNKLVPGLDQVVPGGVQITPGGKMKLGF